MKAVKPWNFINKRATTLDHLAHCIPNDPAKPHDEISLEVPPFIKGKKSRAFVQGLLAQIQREQSKVRGLRGERDANKIFADASVAVVEAARYLMDVREIKCAHNHPPPDEYCAKCRMDAALQALDKSK